MASSALRIGGRVASGIVAVGGAAVLVFGGALLPAPAPAVAGVDVTPAAVDQYRACPGPLVRLGDEFGQDVTTVNTFGAPEVTAGTVAVWGAAWFPLADIDVAARADGVASTVITAPSAGADDQLLAGAQAQVASAADVAGLAVAGCTEGAASSWVVAGATDTGRTSMLLLANPNDVAANVDLVLYTADGPVEAPGVQDLVVPPRSQKALSLAGYAPGASQLAVQVRSRGGLVTASLQHAVVRGLEPGGVDVVGRTAAPATTQVIPGVRITTAEAATARSQVGGSQDVQTVVRILAPSADTELSIGVAPESAGGTGTSVDVHAHAGRVLDVPLTGLDDGTYTVTVTATEPVVAAARASTVAPPADGEDEDEESAASDSGSGSGSDAEESEESGIGFDVDGPLTDVQVQDGERVDLAWFSAGGPLSGPAAIAVANAASPRLAVVNPGDATVTLTLTGGGSQQAIELAPGASAGVDLAPNAMYVLAGGGGVSASVTYAGDAELAATPVRPANPLATPLTVYH
ncbi:DUF5719 family protein [Naasia sp. SYSU D00057]|uniref:DUF5719 family protein n=1 Tax=Naasia sp. SYSU D00057 TaxID=2817380 RepID=UPI001B306F06|nr:DUF5719 family protein [Naasia sp. SYSU D00057]